MVKSSSEPKIPLSSSELYQKLQSFLEPTSKINFSTFIPLLLKFSKTKPACKNIRDSYIIIIIVKFLQQITINTEFSFSMPYKYQKLLKDALTLHNAEQEMPSDSILFDITQKILTSTSLPFSYHLSLLAPNTNIVLAAQLLRSINSVSFDMLLKLTQGLYIQYNYYGKTFSRSAPCIVRDLKKQYVLVLDLDETLGHLSGSTFNPRPGVNEFLQEADKFFQLVLFTSSKEEYAKMAMKITDPGGIVKNHFYRQHLRIHENTALKDLSVLKCDLKEVIIIDNDSKNFSLQPENGICIKSWIDDPEDKELRKILDVLLEILPPVGESLESIRLKYYCM